MPEETKQSKAKKIAAARKKLKEYQKRGVDPNELPQEPQQHTRSVGGSSVSSNVSETSDTELASNGCEVPTVSEQSETAIDVMVSSGATDGILESAPSVPTSIESFSSLVPYEHRHEPSSTVNAIQVLIMEKASLTTELNKYRCMCREKGLELEELRLQYSSNSQRLDDLQQRFLAQQQAMEQLRNSNAELQHKLAQANAMDEDQTSHLNELKRLLTVIQERAVEMEQQLKEKCNELEMAQLRIRQLSDEANISKDNRVETLTQTQFMYEQQIRDLQAMVQQLSQDKGQSSSQYQSYVQHLNAEVSKLNEKNSELMTECGKHQERERELVDHISGLEREIQKNLSRQDQFKAEKKQESEEHIQQYVKEIDQLKEKINDFDFERHEFQLKIKSQEDRLMKLESELETKQQECDKLKEHFSNVAANQPNQTKLLATIESDKVAASRALAQNIELKKQLDELELRFVQLTNDKADLMNKLDAEEYANREMCTNFEKLEERLQSSENRFKFKDIEMIRLSRENMELSHNLLVCQQQVDRLQHYEVATEHAEKAEEVAPSNVYDHKHSQDNEPHDHGCDHDQMHQEHHNGCGYVHEVIVDNVATEYEHHPRQETSASSTAHIPKSEAVEKLQHRFTQLMSQVADLTEEKQRLEHLVLQLQSETETIGEYITLYQTQRRILKQREYEKAAQMQLLKQEREQMRDKIMMLNNLVSSLSTELPHHVRLKEHFNAALTESTALHHGTPPSDGPDVRVNDSAADEELNESVVNEKFNLAESQQILSKIQDIIIEIKESTKEMPNVPAKTADHLKCCLGKFEVV